MIPGRIENIEISKKSALSILSGKVNDLFISGDCIEYSFEEVFYMYLKSKEFDSIVFYSANKGFHSFSEKDLLFFLSQESKPNLTNRTSKRATRKPSPLSHINTGTIETRNSEENGNTFEKMEFLGKEYFRGPTNTQVYDSINKAFNKKYSKIAIIINETSTANTNIGFGGNSFFADTKLMGLLVEIFRKETLLSQQHKIIFNYGTQETFKEGDLPIEIMNQLFFKEGENIILKNECQIKIGLPQKDEIENLLNYLRFENNLNTFNEGKYEKLKTKLLQKRIDLKDIKKIKIEELINEINDKSAWDRLNDFQGIDNIIEQFKKNINAIKKNKEQKRSMKIRPHMCFKGNPGTGKTVIAEIFADILREENILSIGGLEKVTVGDLIAEHIGGTRIKTQSVCEKAKGSVLFIDEAYGINNQEGNNNFDKEAVEVLIQFMENNEDSLIILAGYTEDIDTLIKEGNKGFTSRFNSNYHFNFNDYDADTLFSIAISKLKEFESSESFKTELKKVIEKMCRQKDENWGNARSVENLVQDILSNYYNNDNSQLDENHIPSDFRDKSNEDMEKGFNSLDSLVGLNQMKTTLNNILNSIKADKLRNEITKTMNPDYKLNFVFSGNPGTGKTTVARMMGKILHSLQLISSSEVIELTRDKVIQQYVGQTAPNVTKLFDKAIGKVLFIDEAYAICNDDRDLFGKEAIDTIVGNLTKPKYMGKMVVIFAGYSDDMQDFISKNAGLERRISYYINFEDYSNEDLWDILKLKVKSMGLEINDDLKNLGIDYFSSLSRNKNFANAGAADRLLGVLKSNLDNRIVQLENPTIECLTTIQVSDFPNYNYSIENDALNQPKNNNESVKIRIINSHKLIDDIGELSKSIGLILLDNGSSGEGSCFLVSNDGLVFTCEHCVPENKKISIRIDNQLYDDLELLYKNKELDIAILKIKGVADLPYLNINSSFKGLKMGDKIGLLAFPKGREMGAKVTYTEGIVSKKEGIHYHHTANATHGSSGGAFFDLETKTVYGILNGGFGHEGANINVALDIIQLYKQNDIAIEFN